MGFINPPAAQKGAERVAAKATWGKQDRPIAEGRYLPRWGLSHPQGLAFLLDLRLLLLFCKGYLFRHFEAGNRFELGLKQQVAKNFTAGQDFF